MVNRNTEWVYFQGKGSWFKNIFIGDNDYKNWNIKLHFTPESKALFLKLKEREGDVEGILNELKNDMDGDYHVFKRPFFKDFGNGDEPLQPPIVVDKNNHPWDNKVMVGNGSDITVKCELYGYSNRRTKKKGKAIRLLGIMINNPQPYTSESLTDREKLGVQGLMEQQEQF